MRQRQPFRHSPWMHLTIRILLRVAIGSSIAVRLLAIAAFADERPASRAIQEEVWAIPVTLPTIAYVVRPVGNGPFPLVVMNHGVSLNQRERSFFPLVEFRDAAMWFARRGYMVVAPAGGYGAAALDDPERGIYSVVLFKDRRLRQSELPRCRTCGGVDRQVDHRLHDRAKADRAGQSHCCRPIRRRLGARSRCRARTCPAVRAIITFAAGRGGRVDGKPNNNCAPDKLVAATGRIRPHRPHPHAVDLHRERYVLWAGLIQANARGLYRRRRKCRISPASSVRQRRSFPDQFARQPFRCGRRWSEPFLDKHG